MKDLKNIIRLFGIVMYPVAVIGGVGYCCYIHQYLIAAAIIILGIEAFPTWRKLWPEKSKN